jgi:hypothetical protein
MVRPVVARLAASRSQNGTTMTTTTIGIIIVGLVLTAAVFCAGTPSCWRSPTGPPPRGTYLPAAPRSARGQALDARP